MPATQTWRNKRQDEIHQKHRPDNPLAGHDLGMHGRAIVCFSLAPCTLFESVVHWSSATPVYNRWVDRRNRIFQKPGAATRQLASSMPNFDSRHSLNFTGTVYYDDLIPRDDGSKHEKFCYSTSERIKLIAPSQGVVEDTSSSLKWTRSCSQSFIYRLFSKQMEDSAVSVSCGKVSPFGEESTSQDGVAGGERL